jgi:predicted dehydrogenase
VPDILDNAYVIVEYTGGARAMLDLCMFAEGSRHEQQLAITGDIGKLETTIPGNELFASKREGMVCETIKISTDPRIREMGLHHGASYLEHLEFIDAIQSGKPPAVTTEDGLWSVILGLAGQRSIETGLPVSISELVDEHSK